MESHSLGWVGLSVIKSSTALSRDEATEAQDGNNVPKGMGVGGHLWKSQAGTQSPAAAFHILPEGTASSELPGPGAPGSLLLYQFSDRGQGPGKLV